jgi:hypothetical protein
LRQPGFEQDMVVTLGALGVGGRFDLGPQLPGERQRGAGPVVERADERMQPPPGLAGADARALVVRAIDALG